LIITASIKTIQVLCFVYLQMLSYNVAHFYKPVITKYIEEAMQVTSEAVSGVARRLNVSVPTSRINEQFEARLKRTAKTARSTASVQVKYL